MTEVGWLSLATSLLTLIGLLFKYWVDAAYKEKIVQDVAAVKMHVKEVSSELDGRLTEFKNSLEAKAVIDVAAALVAGREEGKREGMAIQRMQGADMVKVAERAADSAVEKGAVIAEKKKNGG